MIAAPRTTSRVVLDRCDPRAFRDDLVALFERNGDTGIFPTLFDWYYRDYGEGPPISWLIRSQKSGLPVGICSVSPRELRWPPGRLRAGVLGNLLVDRDHRKTLAAIELVRAAQALVSRNELDVLLGTPKNERVRQLVLRLGFAPLGAWDTCALIFRSRALLKPRLRWVGTALSPLVDVWAASKRLYATGGRRNYAKYQVRELEQADIESLDVSSWCAPDCRFTGQPSPAFLRWRFVDAPVRRYRVLGLAEAPSSTICGYVIVTSESRRIRVWDCRTDAARLSESTALLTVAQHGRGNGDILSVSVLAASPVCSDLQGLGFVRCPSFWGLSGESPQLVGYWSPDHPLAKELAKPENWNLFVGFNDV